ncbi:hypothetical protein GCM10007036_14090 [Alsobacter metallidurans]|uniref:DUF2786 domain-containing protein n=1 Tax=Alsobacter metallidurans TaxID=340221 RepID=A0A917I6J4_9HYPH|nr:DUF2786 domain-containing protein [Alsobacter metallidurans]GGH14633.1 hypothetical protein GCM10007036_14090 [Alsobacter metallidurans]
MTDFTVQEKLKHRIRALLAKSVENGASEHEALAAAEKAQELLAKYGLSREEMDAEAFVLNRFADKSASRGFNWSEQLAYGVAVFTGTFPFRQEGVITLHGRETDGMFANWLIDALDGFVSRQAMAYAADTGGIKSSGKASKPRPFGQSDLFGSSSRAVEAVRPETEWQRKDRMKSFAVGVCHRIEARLIELATAETRRRMDDARNDLVKNRGMSFKKGGTRRDSIGDKGAYAAGQRAGDSAAFNRPVGGSRGSAAPLQIGGR